MRKISQNSSTKPFRGHMAKTEPTPKCEKCKKNITAIKFPGLSCCLCKNYFHSGCVNLANDTLDALLKSGADWSCSGCKPKCSGRRSIIIPSSHHLDSSNPPVTPSNSNNSHNSSIIADNSRSYDPSKLSSDIQNMRETISTFKDSIEFFNGKFDEFKIKMDGLTELLTRVTSLEERIGKIELESTNQHQDNGSISDLSDKVNRLEQAANDNSLFLCGIPELECDELSTVDLAVEFLNKIEGLYISRKDMKFTNRITPRRTESTSTGITKPRKILIRFHSTNVRDSVKMAVRAKKRVTRTLNFCDHNVNFYAADYLTPFYNQLLYSARDFARLNKCHSVWVSNSNILLKNTRDSIPVIIRNLTDLQKLSLKDQTQE